MERVNINDAIKNVKSFYSPNKNEMFMKSNNKNKIKNSPTDFSFKKKLNNLYEEDINTKETSSNENIQKSIYSKNEDNIFSSGNFGTKKDKEIINNDNINISNFSVFKESNKYSSFDNYLYSSSANDNMDFNFTNNSLINDNLKNENEIKPFLLLLSNKNENKRKMNINFTNINNKKEYNENNNQLLICKRDIYKNKLKKEKNYHEKSINNFIVLNNTAFHKELKILNKDFLEIPLLKENKENIFKEEENKINKSKNTYFFPNNNNYVSIRKAFEDITNKNFQLTEKSKNKKSFKANMPKNFEIHKRKINIIKFEELIQKENNKINHIEKKRGGCICRQFKNKL